MEKKLIIFGGSFDPIHKNHVRIALKAFKKIKADKLFFVPCGSHPHSKKISALNDQRIEMIKLAIKGYPRFEICDYETKNKNASYTIDTIEYFKKNFQDYKLYLLIGFDQLIKFKKWYRYEEILKHATILCHCRIINKSNIAPNNLNFDDSNKIFETKKKQNKYQLVPFVPIGWFDILMYRNVCSSKLRIKPNKIDLNKDVLNYINENGIYAVNRLKKVMSEYRLAHSIRVANIAVELAKSLKYYSLIKKAYVAGIYHDYAKEYDRKIQENFFTKLKIKYFKYPSWKVIHGPLGAYEVKKKFFIDDTQILNAIKNHTIPNEFHPLTKIIYCADKLDIRHDGQIDNHKEIYELCKKDIDAGFKMIIDQLNKGKQ